MPSSSSAPERAMALASWLRDQRVARDLTQANVANTSGIPLRTYARFERTGHLTVPRLMAVFEALGLAGDATTVATKLFTGGMTHEHTAQAASRARTGHGQAPAQLSNTASTVAAGKPSDNGHAGATGVGDKLPDSMAATPASAASGSRSRDRLATDGAVQRLTTSATPEKSNVTTTAKTPESHPPLGPADPAIRNRYRGPIVSMVSAIVWRAMTYADASDYVATESKSRIPEADRAAFAIAVDAELRGLTPENCMTYTIMPTQLAKFRTRWP